MKRKGINSALIVTAMLLIAVVVACAAPAPAPTPAPTPAPAPAPAPTPPPASIAWRTGNLTTPDHYANRIEVYWSEQMDKLTNGRLKISVFGGGALSKGPDALDVVDKGIVQSHDAFASFIGSREPWCDVLELPGLVPADMAIRKKLWAGLYPEFQKIFESKYNVLFYGLAQAEPRDLFTKSNATRLANLKGMKVRTSGVEADFTTALGGVPVFVAFPEIYTGAQQGLFDGNWQPPSTIGSSKLYEVQSYMIKLGVSGATSMWFINKDAFKALPADIQKIVNDFKPSFAAKWAEFVEDAITKERSNLVSKGMKVIEWPKEDIDQMQKLGKPVWDTWLKKTGADGKRLLDKAQELLK